MREAKKAAKRERREAERRAAVEELAAAAPLSPRNTAQRARERLRSDGGSRGGSRGDWLMGSEDWEEGGGGREASPGVPRGGSVGSQGADDGGLLVDTLSSRWACCWVAIVKGMRGFEGCSSIRYPAVWQ